MKSVFVYNPESGKGKIKKYKNYILKKLSEKYGEIDCIETTYAGHAHDIAKDSVSKYDYFFVSGGDGTINEVINGMGSARPEDKPIIGYLPSGTVNDVARSLGISRNIKKAVKNLLVGIPFEHDIFKVNNRYGIYVCCTGLFTKASYDTNRYQKKKYGKLAYFNNGLKELKETKPLLVQVKIDDKVIEKKCALVLILNSRSVAGFRLNKHAKLNDGEVEIALFHSDDNKIDFAELLAMANTFVFGLKPNTKNKHITYLKASSFEISTAEGTTINLDGEKSQDGSFKFNVLNKAVKIIAPKKLQMNKF